MPKETFIYSEKEGKVIPLLKAEPSDSQGPALHIFKPDWFEHIAPEPIFIESKEQLRRECAKYGCRSKLLEGGYNR